MKPEPLTHYSAENAGFKLVKLVVGTCKETFEVAPCIPKQAPLSEVEGVRETKMFRRWKRRKHADPADASDRAGS